MSGVKAGWPWRHTLMEAESRSIAWLCITAAGFASGTDGRPFPLLVQKRDHGSRSERRERRSDGEMERNYGRARKPRVKFRRFQVRAASRRPETALNSARGVLPRCRRQQIGLCQARRRKRLCRFPPSTALNYPGRFPAAEFRGSNGETAGALPDRGRPHRLPRLRPGTRAPPRRKNCP